LYQALDAGACTILYQNIKTCDINEVVDNILVVIDLTGVLIEYQIDILSIPSQLAVIPPLCIQHPYLE